MNTLRLIIGFVIILIVAVVVVANIGGESLTTVRLLAAEKAVTVGVLILFSWACGVVSYAIIALVGEIQTRARLARSQREKDVLMRELNDLRNLPLAGEEPLPPSGETEGKEQT